MAYTGTFDNYFCDLHYQPDSHWKDKLVTGWVLYEERESADTVLDCGTLCFLDNNRELKHQTFLGGATTESQI